MEQEHHKRGKQPNVFTCLLRAKINNRKQLLLTEALSDFETKWLHSFTLLSGLKEFMSKRVNVFEGQMVDLSSLIQVNDL